MLFARLSVPGWFASFLNQWRSVAKHMGHSFRVGRLMSFDGQNEPVNLPTCKEMIPSYRGSIMQARLAGFS